MSLAALPIPRVLAACGAAYGAAILLLILSKAPLGSRIFFGSVAVAVAAYWILLARVWSEPRAPRRLLLTAFALAVLFRIPPAVAPVSTDNDMVRYLWDGRVQQLGYNPYAVRPADPALAHTHKDRSALMPSRHDRTPYPPAAQLFFRLVVTISDSTRAMKLALVLCDLLTMVVLWRWLAITQRSEWLALAYAWNPLVVLEVAHSGHIDALGALWTAAAAFWLARRRTQLATIALVLAIATKLLPVVLAPLFVGRIRKRDALVGAMCLGALYLPFASGGEVPLGAVPNVVDRVRFNGPIFAMIATGTSPRMAAAVALVLGLSAAAWARWRLSESDPAAWAWPMAIAIACAPVIYPWYLLYVTPFLFSLTTVPLTVWTVSIVSVYEVWEQSRNGGRWITPVWVMAFEFGVVLAAAGFMRWRWLTRARRTRETTGSHEGPRQTKTHEELR
jgi:alpha-1,6-mannosyltransferase